MDVSKSASAISSPRTKAVPSSSMAERDWEEGFANSLGVFLNGEAIPSRDPRGARVLDDSFYILFNAWNDAMTFTLPEGRWGDRWRLILSTSEPVPIDKGEVRHAGETIEVEALSLTVLSRIASER